MQTQVLFDDVVKTLRILPHFIVKKLNKWAKDVERFGIEEVRKIPGYHDEPLQGRRHGQRSIRLSRAYRAIYVLKKDGSAQVVHIKEISKHEY